jgi:septum formation protein
MTTREAPGDFILASASPRRWELLRQIGLSFRVVPSRVLEANRGNMEPRNYALYWATSKANEVTQRYPQEWVLAADTIVVLGREILGKPNSEAEARDMLSRLGGREHKVITGLCLTLGQESIQESMCVETKVFMRTLTPEDIEGYINTGEPMDKAGGYGIQGIGGCLVQRIEGSYSNVVGLPLCEVVELLRSHGVAAPFGGYFNVRLDPPESRGD